MASSNIAALNAPRPNVTAAWSRLAAIKQAGIPSAKALMAADPRRVSDLSVRTDKVFFNYSRQLVDGKVMSELFGLAQETGVPAKIEAMFGGEKINATEGRAVLHTALRNLPGIEDPKAAPVLVDGQNVMIGVKEVLGKVEKFSAEIHNGTRLGATGKKIKNIVAIGIGGSYLGPEYLAEACKPYAKEDMNLVFVANVDGTDFARKTAGLDPEETLVIVISKTFTTAETMMNARTAREWMLAGLAKKKIEQAEIIKKHFVAVSTAEKLVQEFGIDPENMFGFWDWVGGRFSATSAVGGLPLSLFLGYENFHKILKGAYWMDRHFAEAPLERNIPVIAALIDIWNINFLGYKTRAILPYSQALMEYAPHCQQVEMESNGKSVDISGRPVDYATGESVFGEPGTNGQHSFYQLIHQGTEIIPADFIGFCQAQVPELAAHHRELMTNFLAQPQALLLGKTDENPAKCFSGDRPTNTFLLGAQDPFAAGLLLALLEHRVAVKGFVWGINSFDQFGVELGKKLGVDIRTRFGLYNANPDDPAVSAGLDQATVLELKYYLEGGF